MKRIQRNPDVLWREEEDAREQVYEGLANGKDVEDVGTSVLFSDGMMLSLNLLGTEIWKMCDGMSLDEIVAELAMHFEVESDVLREDVENFLAELAEKGFISYGE